MLKKNKIIIIVIYFLIQYRLLNEHIKVLSYIKVWQHQHTKVVVNIDLLLQSQSLLKFT